MVRPGDLTGHSDFHLFKEGIKPMWEVSWSSHFCLGIFPEWFYNGLLSLKGTPGFSWVQAALLSGFPVKFSEPGPCNLVVL